MSDEINPKAEKNKKAQMHNNVGVLVSYSKQKQNLWGKVQEVAWLLWYY